LRSLPDRREADDARRLRLKKVIRKLHAKTQLAPLTLDRATALQVANDRAIALVALPGPVVDADDGRRWQRRPAVSAHDPQQSDAQKRCGLRVSWRYSIKRAPLPVVNSLKA
jgi:hypothetical protein